MKEDYDPKEYALSLGFSEDEAAMLGWAGAPADNILRMAASKGYVQPEATEDTRATEDTGSTAVSAAEATSPEETEDERADREAAELRADADVAASGDRELITGGAVAEGDEPAPEAETKHRHYYRADGTCACGRRRKGS